MKRLIVTCAFVLLATASWAQTPDANIDRNGRSTMKATLAGKSIQVEIHTMQVKRPELGFPLAVEGHDEVSIVRQIVITINGEEIGVPRAVYADLFNIRKASLKAKDRCSS